VIVASFYQLTPRLPSASGRAPPAVDHRNRRSGAQSN